MIPNSKGRPTYKELTGKIRAARDAVERSAVFLLHQELLIADALDLGYLIEEELEEVLLSLLDEAHPSRYAGTHPPQRSYEQEISGMELFAFVVDCSRLACRVYFKFALRGDALWVVSLHRDRGGTS